SAEKGAATWSGDDAPSHQSDNALDVPQEPDPGSELAGSLAAFVTGIRSGAPMMCEAADNVLSLAMVEAAVASAESGVRVRIDDVLERAHTEALAREVRDDVRAALAG